MIHGVHMIQRLHIYHIPTNDRRGYYNKKPMA